MNEDLMLNVGDEVFEEEYPDRPFKVIEMRVGADYIHWIVQRTLNFTCKLVIEINKTDSDGDFVIVEWIHKREQDFGCLYKMNIDAKRRYSENMIRKHEAEIKQYKKNVKQLEGAIRHHKKQIKRLVS